MNDTELKPCPFCGCNPVILNDKRYPWRKTNVTEFDSRKRRNLQNKEPIPAWEVVCDTKGCPCYHSDFTFSLSEKKAIEKWNTRKPIQRIVEQLEEALDDNVEAVNTSYDYCKGFEDAINIVKKGGAE